MYIDMHVIANRLTDPTAPSEYCILEDRYGYGVSGYGDVIGALNPSDGDPWDVFVPGVRGLPYGVPLRITKLYGIVTCVTGNSKLAIGVEGIEPDPVLVYKDIRTFSENYTRRHRFRTSWIPADEAMFVTMHRNFHAFRGVRGWNVPTIKEHCKTVRV